MSMPDKWEYPWFAAWDLAFHCVALAHVDPAFAKYQLILLCREWFQHPNGALPAYEWDFGDVNPPVQAWAALEVFVIDGGRDIDFLSQVFDKLLVNFTWWVNLEDATGSNLFEGGFLGLDNIGPLDRSHLPVGGTLQQADATGWMASYALAMGDHRHLPAPQRPPSRRRPRPQVPRALRRDPQRASGEQGLWDDGDGLFYDRLVTPDGTTVPVEVRSMVGIIPMLAAGVIDEAMLDRAVQVGKSFAEVPRARRPARPREARRGSGSCGARPGHRGLLLGVVGIDRLERLFGKLFDEAEFLSPHGLRALSAYHREHPYELEVGGVRARIDYEPAESTTAMFGGNSNWRGPLWFPLNYLVISALERYDRFFGDDYTVEYPTGSGRQLPLSAIVADLRERLVSIFLVGPDGRRPCFGGVERLQNDPAWKDNLVFSEYFHGDNGAGLGASHQTGWTGVVADLIRRRHGAVPSIGDALRAAAAGTAAAMSGASAPGRRGRASGSRWAPLSATAARTSPSRPGWPTGCCCACSTSDGAETRIPMPDRDGGVWHAFVPGVGAGQAYGYRATGPYDPARGAALQPGQAAARPLRPGDQRRGPVRAGGARPRARRPRHAEHPRLGRARAAQPGGRPRPTSGPPSPARPAGTPTRSSTRSTSRGSPRPTRTSRRSCAAPTPGSATRRPSPTCSISASPRSSCSRCTSTCPRPSSRTAA